MTFARVDHEVEDDEIPGVVVSRINLSPRFMRELIDAMEDNYSKWRTREGIKSLPEWGGRGRRARAAGPAGGVVGARRPRRPPAIPMRSTSSGACDISACSSRGGSGSATLRTTSRVSKPMNAPARPSSAARRVGPPLDARERWLAIVPTTAATSAGGERAGPAARRARPRRAPGASVSSAVARIAAGATSSGRAGRADVAMGGRGRARGRRRGASRRG